MGGSRPRCKSSSSWKRLATPRSWTAISHSYTTCKRNGRQLQYANRLHINFHEITVLCILTMPTYTSLMVSVMHSTQFITHQIYSLWKNPSLAPSLHWGNTFDQHETTISRASLFIQWYLTDSEFVSESKFIFTCWKWRPCKCRPMWSVNPYWARGAVFVTAFIQPADSSLKLKLEKIPWKPEQWWLFDKRKKGATSLVAFCLRR